MTDNKPHDIDEISWKRMRFKKNKVWLATDRHGKPVYQNGKVLIKYQLDQDYEYWVHENGIKPVEPSSSGKEKTDEKLPKKRATEASDPDPEDGKALSDVITIYTDGASSGNPGPSGIGALLRFGKHEKEISKYIGIATNNIAELKAIEAGLSELKKTDHPVRIFTDSKYAYGVLTLGWKARKNIELIRSIKAVMSTFKDLTLVKVKGHAGIDGNERADRLATQAIKNGVKKKKKSLTPER